MSGSLEETAERFADALFEAISVRVRTAIVLERERTDAELAELRDEILTLARRLDAAQTASGEPVNYCRSCGQAMGVSVYRGRQYPVCRNRSCSHADVLVTMHSEAVPE